MRYEILEEQTRNCEGEWFVCMHICAVKRFMLSCFATGGPEIRNNLRVCVSVCMHVYARAHVCVFVCMQQGGLKGQMRSCRGE